MRLLLTSDSTSGREIIDAAYEIVLHYFSVESTLQVVNYSSSTQLWIYSSDTVLKLCI